MIDLGGDVTGNGISKLVFTILLPWLRPSAIAPASASNGAGACVSRGDGRLGKVDNVHLAPPESRL
jgi:hypothetical protein